MFPFRMNVFFSSWVIGHLCKSASFSTKNDLEGKVWSEFHPSRIKVIQTATAPAYPELASSIVSPQVLSTKIDSFLS